MASDGSKPKSNPIVGKIVKDPKSPPNALCLRGFVGDSPEDKSVRLYFDANFSDYVDVPEAAILHSEPVPEAWSPFGAMYLWIERDAELMHGSERVKANFMQGRIFQQQAGAQAAAAQPQMQQPGPFPGGPGGIQITPPQHFCPPSPPLHFCPPTPPQHFCPPSPPLHFCPPTPPQHFCPPSPPLHFCPPTPPQHFCPPSPPLHFCPPTPPQHFCPPSPPLHFCPPTPPQHFCPPSPPLHFCPPSPPQPFCPHFPIGDTPAAQPPFDPRMAEMGQAQQVAGGAAGMVGAQDFQITPFRTPVLPCFTPPFICRTLLDPNCFTPFCPSPFICPPFPLGNTPVVQQPMPAQPMVDPRMGMMAQAQPQAAAIQPGIQPPGGPVIGVPHSPPWFHCPPSPPLFHCGTIAFPCKTQFEPECFIITRDLGCTAFPPCGISPRPFC